MPRARVYVTLKKSVFDPQGRTIQEALVSMGYQGVAGVRQGKFFEVDLEGIPPERAKETVKEEAQRQQLTPQAVVQRVVGGQQGQPGQGPQGPQPQQGQPQNPNPNPGPTA